MTRTVETSAYDYADSRNARIDPALAETTGCAQLTRRYFEHSEATEYSEEWAEPAVLPTGEKVSRMYLFSPEEIVSEDGDHLDVEDYPWDDAHVVRIEIHD